METGLQLTTVAALLAAALAIEKLGRVTRLPRITLLVIFGMLVGPSGLAILPAQILDLRELISILALTMIAFLLGAEFSVRGFRAYGQCILKVSFFVVVVSLLCIAGGMLLIGVPLVLAMLLAGVGLATDPAATRDVVIESKSTGPITKTILGVVAVDDAWAVIVFSVILGMVAATGAENGYGIRSGIKDVLIATGIGVGVGVPAAFLSGRLRAGEPTLLEATIIVLLCAGFALLLDVSFLLTGMAAGATVVNLARHHEFSFNEIEHISAPFLVLFFILAGTIIDFGSVADAGLIGITFIVLRLLGRFVGGWIGARAGGMTPRESLWIGLALTPQAGVALGMALAAGHAVPAYAHKLMTLTVATVVFFELVGPIMTQVVLKKLGEAGTGEDSESENGGNI